MRRLIIRPGAIGDLILSLPALECMAGQRPGAGGQGPGAGGQGPGAGGQGLGAARDYLEVWVAAPNVPLVRFADRVRAIAPTGLDLLGITEPPPRLMEELRGFDSILSWYGANRPEFRSLVQSLGLPFTFFRALPPEGCGMHATDFYLDQAGAIANCQSDGIPRIPCPGPRENFAVIHPFSGSPRKNWPLEKFRLAAQKLERLMPVRWCSGPEDPPLEPAVRIPDLYELACWLARARLYIGNDSGITHLAAAAGTPVLALFGPTDPAVWAPRGPHVRVATWRRGA